MAGSRITREQKRPRYITRPVVSERCCILRNSIPDVLGFEGPQRSIERCRRPGEKERINSVEHCASIAENGTPEKARLTFSRVARRSTGFRAYTRSSNPSRDYVSGKRVRGRKDRIRDTISLGKSLHWEFICWFFATLFFAYRSALNLTLPSEIDFISRVPWNLPCNARVPSSPILFCPVIVTLALERRDNFPARLVNSPIGNDGEQSATRMHLLCKHHAACENR